MMCATLLGSFSFGIDTIKFSDHDIAFVGILLFMESNFSFFAEVYIVSLFPVMFCVKGIHYVIIS